MANYYISNTGNDAGDGLTELTAWKTIAKANTALPAILLDGDSILFKCGDTWAEAAGLSIDSSKAISIGSYSTGNKPKITPPMFDYGILIAETGGAGKIIYVDNIEFVGNYVGIGIGCPFGENPNIDLRVTDCYFNLCWSLSSSGFAKETYTDCIMDCVDDYALIHVISGTNDIITLDHCVFNLTNSTEIIGYGFQFTGSGNSLFIRDCVFTIDGMTSNNFYFFDSQSPATGNAIAITRSLIRFINCTKEIRILNTSWRLTTLMSACIVMGITHGFKTTVNGFTTVENCLLYGLGSSAGRYIFDFQNNTTHKITNCVLGNTGSNVVNATGADISYCVSDDATISGDNNYASATLLNELISLTYGAAGFATPKTGSNAESKGTTPLISSADFNNDTWSGYTIGAITNDYTPPVIIVTNKKFLTNKFKLGVHKK